MNLFSSKDNHRNHCENPKLLLFVTCDQTFQWTHFILSTPVLVSYSVSHSVFSTSQIWARLLSFLTSILPYLILEAQLHAKTLQMYCCMFFICSVITVTVQFLHVKTCFSARYHLVGTCQLILWNLWVFCFLATRAAVLLY